MTTESANEFIRVRKLRRFSAVLLLPANSRREVLQSGALLREESTSKWRFHLPRAQHHSPRRTPSSNCGVGESESRERQITEDARRDKGILAIFRQRVLRQHSRADRKRGGRVSDKVKPLQSRTMTLEQLQAETLKLIRKVRKQFNRMPYDDGMSDDEFISYVLEPLEHRISADQFILKQAKEPT